MKTVKSVKIYIRCSKKKWYHHVETKIVQEMLEKQHFKAKNLLEKERE